MGEGFSGWRVEAGEAAPCSGRFPLPLLPASPARPASEPARHRFGVALRLPAPVPRVITTAGSFPSPLVPRFHPSPCSGRHVSRPEPYSLPPRQSPFQKSSWGFGGFFQEAPNVFPAPCVPGTTRRRKDGKERTAPGGAVREGGQAYSAVKPERSMPCTRKFWQKA